MVTAAPERPRSRRARSEELAEQIYAAHRSRLLAIARRNCAVEEAEEALQDAFILFIERFDPGGAAPPLAWLTLTLKRRCWELGRRRQRTWTLCGEHHPEGCPDPGRLADAHRHPDELLDLTEEVASVRSQLATLKRDERRAISLLALGHSYREIGELTGWSYTKVNRCLAEGRAALRELAG